jgi:hypothetical protein
VMREMIRKYNNTKINVRYSQEPIQLITSCEYWCENIVVRILMRDARAYCDPNDMPRSAVMALWLFLLPESPGSQSIELATNCYRLWLYYEVYLRTSGTVCLMSCSLTHRKLKQIRDKSFLHPINPS